MLKTIADVMHDRVYAFIYGAEGSGKTRLAMTMSRVEGGTDVAYITGDYAGPTAVVSAGYSEKIPVWLLPDHRQPPFKSVLQGIHTFTADPKIKVIVLDACTTISANAMMHYGLAQGKKLEHDDWAKVMAGFLKIENAAYLAVLAGKSFIYTAWEKEPTIVNTAGGEDTVVGRPWIHGQGKTWLPGKCDIIGRLTSSTSKSGEWKGRLQVHSSDEWLAKTRWNLPFHCPPDLGKILQMVRKQKAGTK